MKGDGLLLVDKAMGMTSHDVVAKARRTLGRKDIGHAGTLDPMATGLLVLLLGQATKLSDFILKGEKTYHAEFQLGLTTDTLDVTGEVLEQNPHNLPGIDAITEAAQALSGVLELPVPHFSAVKVNGEKLYQKARKGESFEPPMKTMSFDDLKIHGIEGRYFRVSFRCRKGSYVRAWGKALGDRLGCGAAMSALRRVESSPYRVEGAIPLETLAETASLEETSAFIPLRQTLPDWPTLRVDGLDEKLLRNGQIPRRLERFLELEYGERQDLEGIKLTSRQSGALVAILSHESPLEFKIRRVFPIKH